MIHHRRSSIRLSVTPLSMVFTAILALFATLTLQPAYAAFEADTYEGLSQDGEFATAEINMPVLQSGIKKQSLDAIWKWRWDALHDTRVRIGGKTVRQLLTEKGMSDYEYLNPIWNYGAERIAIQRAVEANSLAMWHYRYTAGLNIAYRGQEEGPEVLAWGHYKPTIGSAVEKWAEEKTYLIEKTPNEETGHYIFLIDPDCFAYGFGGATHGQANVWAGTCVTEGQRTGDYVHDESATGWSGWKTFTMPVAEQYYKNATPSAWKVTLREGQSTQFYWSSSFDGDYYRPAMVVRYRGELTTGDRSIAAASGDWITGVSQGTTWVKFKSGPMERWVQVDVLPEVPDANATWVVRDNDIAVGAAPVDGNYSKYEYRWLSYRVDSGKWTTISNWSSGNWASWAQDKGVYWLQLQMRNKQTKKVVVTKTIAFAHTPGKHSITGTYAGTQANGSVLLGVSSSNPQGKLVTKIYDVARKTWVAQYQGNWNTWRPSPGVYWTHYELYTPAGQLQDVRTYAFQMGS